MLVSSKWKFDSSRHLVGRMMVFPEALRGKYCDYFKQRKIKYSVVEVKISDGRFKRKRFIGCVDVKKKVIYIGEEL